LSRALFQTTFLEIAVFKKQTVSQTTNMGNFFYLILLTLDLIGWDSCLSDYQEITTAFT